MCLNMLPAADKEATVEWKTTLSVVGENHFPSGSFPAELHTLNVIEAHLLMTAKPMVP